MRVTAWAKTRDAASGARFSLEAWTYGAVLAADSGDAWQTGTNDWARIDRSIPVDSSAHAVVITLQFRGTGSAWFDDLVFSIDGRAMEAVPVAPTPTQADREWMTGTPGHCAPRTPTVAMIGTWTPFAASLATRV